jgi:bla regulator protein blaR1
MNGIAQDWLGWLLLATWQGSVLVGVVLIVQALLGPRLPSRWRCALWWVVLARLLLPMSLASPVSLFNVDVLAPPIAIASFSSTPGAGAWVWPALFWIWMAGMVWMAVRIGQEHLKLRRALIRRRLVTDSDVLEVLEDCKILARVHTPLVMVETNRVKSPALFGFIRPRLLLPEGLLRSFSRDDLRNVFVHELSHLRRHDIAWGWFQAAVLVVHWFNPLIWLALRRLRADRELATDELALHHLQVKESRSYGETILKMLDDFARPAPLPAVAGILEDRRQLVGRIRQIAGFGRLRHSTPVSVFVLLVLALVSLTDRRRTAEVESNGPTIEAKTPASASP